MASVILHQEDEDGSMRNELRRSDRAVTCSVTCTIVMVRAIPGKDVPRTFNAQRFQALALRLWGRIIIGTPEVEMLSTVLAGSS